MSWEKDEELVTSRFIRFDEGLNEYVISSDGEKVRTPYGKPAVEFKTDGDRILSIRPGPLLDALRKTKELQGTVVGRKLKFVREGTGTDTKYINVEVI